MKLKKSTMILSVIMAIIPLAILWYFYDQLPQQLPTSFGFDGTVNRTTAKENMWIMSAMPLGFLPLYYFLPKMDPKGRSYLKIAGFYNAFVLIITGFMSAITSMSMLHSLPQFNFDISSIVIIAVGMLLIFVGNYMPKMKQSYTMGIKTPWTLENEVVWNKTHRLGGRCFMGGGLLMMLSIFVPALYPFMMFIVLFSAFFPCFMSYVYYKQEMKKAQE